jgi:hypothetical protein
LAGACQILAPVAPPDLPWRDPTWVHRLFSELTFTHLVEFSRIDDATERAFYELHCLKERWSVRELIRQRGTLLLRAVLTDGWGRVPEASSGQDRRRHLLYDAHGRSR